MIKEFLISEYNEQVKQLRRTYTFRKQIYKAIDKGIARHKATELAIKHIKRVAVANIVSELLFIAIVPSIMTAMFMIIFMAIL